MALVGYELGRLDRPGAVRRGRRGLGRALTNEIAAWATGIGAITLELAATASNDAAIALYELCGFTDTAERGALPEGSEISVMTMRRPLR